MVVNLAAKLKEELYMPVWLDGEGSVYSASTVGINLIKPIKRGK